MPFAFKDSGQNGKQFTMRRAPALQILDEVAARAGFTWRNSYSTFDDPEKYGKTWTDLLKWQIETYGK